MDVAQIRLATGRNLVLYLWLHLPVLAVACGLLGAGWRMPLFGALVLAGAATLNWYLAPRAESSRYTSAVALMGMAALLVRVFEGHLWQADMHMYFFAALAMLTAFCDWRVVILAAGVVAVHHFTLNFLYPAAIFPDGVSFGRLVVHTAIFVVEATALAWLAWNLTKSFGNADTALEEARAAHKAAEDAAAERDHMTGETARQRKADMLALADDFEARINATVRCVVSAATDMNGAARSMAEVAERTSGQAHAAASAAEYASVNVETVAAAAEELSSSIGEINRQVAQASETSRHAEEKAAAMNHIVGELTGAAGRIGQVIDLIQVIASQTNLLALNATIEAARAGESGKGFAVVAGEVKSLANQTAQATGEITRQIGSVQQATAEVVAAIEDISKTIAEINGISSAIAAAVDQQQAATREIARNVEEASSGTTAVATNIGGVRAGATETGQTARNVLGAASSLDEQAEALRGQVETFLSGIRFDHRITE